MDHNTPEIAAAEKKQMWFIDGTIPGDHRIKEIQWEKIRQYKNLEMEIQHLWGKEANTLLIVISVLSTISRALKNYLANRGIDKLTVE